MKKVLCPDFEKDYNFVTHSIYNIGSLELSLIVLVWIIIGLKHQFFIVIGQFGKV